MRIVAGEFRGRRLLAPAGTGTRPTSDRVREALFDILAHGNPPLPDDRDVLDVFAGTGALGLEALSRGAARAAFIENGRRAVRIIRDNVARCGAGDRATVIERDATRPGAADHDFGLVFLDPPYRQAVAERALVALDGNGWLAPGATVVVELARSDRFDAPQGFTVTGERAYGATRVVFLTAP